MSFINRARRPAERALSAVRHVDQAARLARSGMVDLAYYEELTGLRFSSAVLAAAHYLGSDPADGYSLHPLFEAEYLDRRRVRSSEDPAIRYLAKPSAFRRSPHPLFDIATAGASMNSKSGQGNVWLSWVHSATPQTVVPVPVGSEPVTWGELRPLLLDAARRWRETRRAPAPAQVESWQPGMGSPLVSVVLTTRNRAAGLRALLDSVLAQTYSNLELIVVDAGSTDDSAAVTRGVAHFDARVRLLSVATASPAVAREAGLAEARGDFVAFADTGHAWNSQHLAQAVGRRLADSAGPGNSVVAEIFPRNAAPLGLIGPPESRPSHVLDWTGAARAPRMTGLISVIVPVVTDLPAAIAWTELLDGPADGIELVFAGVATRPQFSCLTAISRGRNIRMVAEATANWSQLVNVGALASTGDRLVLVKPGSVITQDGIRRLAAALDDPGVGLAQPLNERVDMTVSSVGAYFPPADPMPTPLLAGHPLSDAERLGDARLPAVYSGVVAVRATDFLALEGLDAAFGNSLAEVDLSLRISVAHRGAAVLVGEARTVSRSQERQGFPHDTAAAAVLLRRRWASPPLGSADLLARAGFAADTHVSEVLGGTQPEHRPVQVQVPQLSRVRTTAGPNPCLRWAIDIPVPAGWWGETWGDRHFANSLAKALRRLGQHVAVDHREARDRPTRKFEDVVLTLRGLDQVQPRLGPLNVLWIISHPDEIEPWELDAYDLAFAASQGWAAEKSSAWGVAIEPLLQCTDAELFRPHRGQQGTGAPALFVGNARQGGSRMVVDYALRTGAKLSIYGGGWDRTAAHDRVRATGVPNGQLGELYGAAGVVLNDHWVDMQANGFISNRLFDAVACGARVLSDVVPGAQELFGGSVQFFEGPSDVVRLLEHPDSSWPNEQERLKIADRVRSEHSFDRRAEVLLQRVLAQLGERSGSDLRRRDGEPPRSW